ncbi:MAG: hypothetical protein JSV32_05410 [Dehalococcoidia bacterium]|nr:MAG: hypothetical protein JSV32_05410 [Dehalococcoidia bacterium]
MAVPSDSGGVGIPDSQSPERLVELQGPPGLEDPTEEEVPLIILGIPLVIGSITLIIGEYLTLLLRSS